MVKIPYLIAEIGINHNGDLFIAKKLIDAAFACGWDCVKFQKRTPDLCVPENQKYVIKDTPWGRMTYIDYKKMIEFGEYEYDFIDEYCKNKPIQWSASVWDLPSLEFILHYDVPFIKIPSAKITELELIKEACKSKKLIILSTGMSLLFEIDAAVDILKSNSKEFVLMHTNSSYPSPSAEINLNVIDTLRERYGCAVGYCIDPNTKILTTDLTWETAENIKIGTEIIGFPEKFDINNKFCKSYVLGKQEYEQDRYYIETEDSYIICSENHKFPITRFVLNKNKKIGHWYRFWVEAKDLIVGDNFIFLVEPWDVRKDHDAGYIAGLLDGEGWVTKRTVGFCQNPGDILNYYKNFIKNELGISKYTYTLPKCKAVGITTNGRRQSLKLLGIIRPKRLLPKANIIWEGLRTWHKTSQSPIKKIEKIGKGKTIGIQTTTGTFVANGFLSHNSGHEYGLEPTVVAASMGVSVIERHITLDHDMWGTDQKASIEINAMFMLKKRIKEAVESMGDGIKNITKSEEPIRKKLRGC